MTAAGPRARGCRRAAAPGSTCRRPTGRPWPAVRPAGRPGRCRAARRALAGRRTGRRSASGARRRASALGRRAGRRARWRRPAGGPARRCRPGARRSTTAAGRAGRRAAGRRACAAVTWRQRHPVLACRTARRRAAVAHDRDDVADLDRREPDGAQPQRVAARPRRTGGCRRRSARGGGPAGRSASTVRAPSTVSARRLGEVGVGGALAQVGRRGRLQVPPGGDPRSAAPRQAGQRQEQGRRPRSSAPTMSSTVTIAISVSARRGGPCCDSASTSREVRVMQVAGAGPLDRGQRQRRGPGRRTPRAARPAPSRRAATTRRPRTGSAPPGSLTKRGDGQRDHGRSSTCRGAGRQPPGRQAAQQRGARPRPGTRGQAVEAERGRGCRMLRRIRRAGVLARLGLRRQPAESVDSSVFPLLGDGGSGRRRRWSTARGAVPSTTHCSFGDEGQAWSARSSTSGLVVQTTSGGPAGAGGLAEPRGDPGLGARVDRAGSARF